MRTTAKIILSAFLLGMLCWVVEEIAVYYVFRANDSIWDSLLFVSPRKLLHNVVVVMVFVAFGIMMAIAIARRTKAEEALSRKADFAHRILNSTDDHLAVLDADGSIVEVNDAWRRFAAENSADETTCNVGANYYCECRDEWGDTSSSSAAFDGVRQVQKGILPAFKIEYPCDSPDEDRWFLLRVLPLIGRQGSVLVYHTNITERKEAENALAESERNFRQLVEQSPISIAIKSERGDINYLNQHFIDTFGYTLEDIPTLEAWLERAHPDEHYRQEALTIWKDSATLLSGKGRDIKRREYQVTCKDGKVRIVEFLGSVFGDKTVVILNDITERKHLEDEKRRFYHDTIQSVTQGKLDLASIEEVREYLDSAELVTSAALPSDAAIARLSVAKFCASKGMQQTRLESFEIAVGEAITNAIKHANGCQVSAGVRGDSFWVGVSDEGPGISALTLPGATLRRGFSTKASMGMGYSIMMEESDAIMLCTGPEGTHVILMANADSSSYDLSLADFIGI